MLNFDKLRAPPADGATLIEPPATAWPAMVERNLDRARRQDIVLAGRRIQELRAATRREVPGEATGNPVLTCGHQPAFVHPGVWAKHVVVQGMAETHGWQACDLVVDNDAPASPTLRVPMVEPDGRVRERQVDFWPGITGAPYEGRRAFRTEEIEGVHVQLEKLLGRRLQDSALRWYLEGLAGGARGDAVEQHLVGRMQVDGRLRARLPEIRVSHVFGGPLLASLLLDAPRFAACYNRALADYREREHVRSPDRPLPNLHWDGARIETAFWIYKPRERRCRLWVELLPDRLVFFANELRVGTVGRDALLREPGGALAELRPWVIRPRALTLTLWARLLVCDLFVHGIGGAKYDRITDAILQGYFGCEPPEFAAVSATLRLPLPVEDVSTESPADVRHSLRDIHFNPQRYVSGVPQEMLEARYRLIAESESLRAARAPRLERHKVFAAIRDLNARMLARAPEIEQRITAELERIGRALESNRVACSREYFYALQPPERLATLAQTLRGELKPPSQVFACSVPGAFSRQPPDCAGP